MSRVDHRFFTSVLRSEVTPGCGEEQKTSAEARYSWGVVLTDRYDPEHKVPENDVCASSHLHLLVLSRCSPVL
jgi:hypothetical protein